MPQTPRLTPSAVLRGYFHAKDENRPLLLEHVFADDAVLQVVNSAASIAFPAETRGRDAIADVFVRRFAQTYENVYSYYLSSPPEDATRFSCAWLVAMTEKDSKRARVGCGRYDWTFQSAPPGLAHRLVITIEAMQVLSPGQQEPVFAWLRRLDYPWTSAGEAVKQLPDIEELAPVRRLLAGV